MSGYGTVTVRVAIHVPLELPAAAERIGALLEDLRGLGVTAAVESPNPDEIDASLDRIQQDLDADDVPPGERADFQRRIDEARSLNDLLRKAVR